jgi:hypothetical protein
MQCILTRSDNELYFGGEAALATEHQNSFTCPFCSKMGFTEATLQVPELKNYIDTGYGTYPIRIRIQSGSGSTTLI